MTLNTIMDVPNLHSIILENKQLIGTVDEIMEVPYVVKKGKMKDTLEKFHIHRETKVANQINDKSTIKQKVLFDTIIKKQANRGHPSLPSQP
jgi:hypothetical protein